MSYKVGDYVKIYGDLAYKYYSRNKGVIFQIEEIYDIGNSNKVFILSNPENTFQTTLENMQLFTSVITDPEWISKIEQYWNVK